MNKRNEEVCYGLYDIFTGDYCICTECGYGPLIIPVLRRLKMDQTEREDGVKSHLKKAGTPTMGGVMILLSVVITIRILY